MNFKGFITAIALVCLTEALPFCVAHSANRPDASSHRMRNHNHHRSHRLVRQKRSENTTALEGVKNKNIRSQLKQQENELIIKTEWEKSLLSAPSAVCLIGELILLASERDFDLYRNSNCTYEQLRHWRFQPAMIQLSNNAWHSFYAAQSNTDRIRLLMLEIPRNMKQAIRILVQLDAKSISRFLRIPLEQVEEAANESLELAMATEKSFINTMILLQEISESLSATDSYNDQRLIDSRKKIEIAKREKQMLDKLKDNMKTQLDKVEKQIADDRKQFDDALDKIPKGWTVVYMNMVYNLNPVNWFRNMAPGNDLRKGGRESVFGNSSGNSSQSTEGQDDQKIGQIKAFQMSENLVKQLNKFVAQCDTDLTKLEKGIFPQELKAIQNNLTSYLDTMIKAVQILQKNLQSLPASKFLNPVINLLQSAIDVLTNFKTGIKGNVIEIKKLIRDNKSELSRVITSAKVFASLGAHVTGSSSIGGSPVSGGGGVIGSNERFVAAQRQSVLLSTQKRYDDYFRDVERLNAEVNEVISELAALDIETVDIEKIQEIIQKAIISMGKLQTLWNKLIQFFTTLTNSVKVSLKLGVERFTRFANNMGIDIIDNNGDKAILVRAKKFMLEEIFRVATVAKSVNSVTSAYVNASKLYILPQISGISGLQALESTEKLAMKKTLVKNTQAAKTNILAMATRRRTEFNGLVHKQLEEIRGIYQITGEPTAEEQEALAAATDAITDLI